MASIRDVAIKAGVGIGTVSRALNGSGYISDETKQKIMQAVEELNYKPNELAQNLFRNKSGFIGIVVKNLSHPFMASLVKHVENNLYTNGYKCMLCEVGDNPNRIEEFVEMLQRNVMDGIICCADIPASVSSQYISALLMIAPYMEKGLEIRLTGKVVSSSYIDMTLQIMREFGAEVGREDTVIGVKPGEYRSVPYRVESDWSAASYFY